MNDKMEIENELSRTQTVRAFENPQDLNLPFRTLSNDAYLAEYTHETITGTLNRRTVSAHGHKRDHNLVTFQLNDPSNPKNWSKAFKWYVTMVIAFVCFVVAMCSSVITPDIKGMQRELGVSSNTVALLSITVFVVGFGLGPMVFAPLSELYGRKIVYASTLALAVVFIIPCAEAKNIETLLVCRAIDGIMFSAPMTLVGGTLADLWRTEERGVPMAAFSAAPFIGPAIGPLVGGYLSEAGGWRWLYWIQFIMSGTIFLILIFTVPETYAPTILARKAAELRQETGDSSYVTEQDLDRRPLSETLSIFMLRPFQLLFCELIVFLLSAYMSVLYGLLYMFFIAYPIVYREGKSFTAGTTGLMFIPLAFGVVLSALCSPFVNRHYLKISHNRYSDSPPPEVRLIPMMYACWFIPIGMFIFAFTSSPHISWVGPCLAGFFVGFGFIFLYNSANNYLVDTYQHQAASALAAKTFLRSMWGAATVLFTNQMYHKLGYTWASALLAFIAVACCGIPYLFYFKGKEIRNHSRFASEQKPCVVDAPANEV